MSRNFIPGCLLLVFLALGLFAQRGEFFIFMLPLLLFLGAGILNKPVEFTFEMSRTFDSHRIEHGQTVDIGLRVTNKGSRLEEILLEDLLPKRFELTKGRNDLLTTLGPGEAAEWEYTVRAFRGQYEFEGLRATISSHLGLFKKKIFIKLESKLVVTPRVLKLKQVVIRPRRTQVHTGSIPTRFGGAGLDFFGTREYQSGDSPRMINWKSTARHQGQLFTKEFEQERIANVGLIFDCRLQSYTVGDRQALLDYVAPAVTALADALMREGNRVGLLVYGNVIDWTFMGSGKVHREKILQAITRIELSQRAIFENLNRIPTRLFPPQSQLIFFSPLQNIDQEPLIHLQTKGYQIIAIIPNPLSFEKMALSNEGDIQLAERILSLKRDLMFRKLIQGGIRVIDWDMNMPFHQVVNQFLNPQPKRSLNLAKTS